MLKKITDTFSTLNDNNFEQQVTENTKLTPYCSLLIGSQSVSTGLRRSSRSLRDVDSNRISPIKLDGERNESVSPLSFSASANSFTSLFPSPSLIYSAKRQESRSTEYSKADDISISNICFNNAYNSFMVFSPFPFIILEC